MSALSTPKGTLEVPMTTIFFPSAPYSFSVMPASAP